MKNTTLLKVLSATAIFSAIAAIEAYDQDNFAFAAETPAAVAPTTPPTATTPATVAPAATPAATTPATTTPKAEEPATVPQDVKALKDGEYKITAEALKFYEEGQPSMAAAAIDNDKTKLIVKNGQYSVSVTFKPVTFGGLTGYLGDLKYYDGDKTHENRKDIQKNEFKDSTIVENYSASETDNFVDAYKKQFPNRTVYPKTVAYNVDKNKIDDNNKLETYTEVFVPVMASINETLGTQKMILKFDLTSLSRKKVTADNYEAATYKNPNKDVEYKGTIKTHINGEVKIGFPTDGIHVQGHFRNANNNDEESLYGSALDSYVRVEKIGEKYKYTLRFKKGLANVGGEFYPFELKKLAYEGKDVPFTTLAKNADSSINEASITTDKLLEKIQLDGTAPYPNGALMSHFVTLQLYYDTATAYKERPAKLEEVVVPAKPKPVTPTPAPVKPKEDPAPAKPAFPDHVVSADKVPTTFPITVKGELNNRTTGTTSISMYENAFVKDVKVEKVGDKYQYTIQVKEGNSTNFMLRNKPFTVSKLTYKGTEINFTEVDAATKLKEGKILTDSLLDKIQVDAVINVETKKKTKTGTRSIYEERAAESTIALDFPTVEATKEEAANNSVPAKIYDASVADKLSMSDGALVHEKTRVEKVNDTYNYYLTFKDLNVGAQVGTVEKLTVDGTVAERTDLGGETHEKVFHFTSPEKLTEKTITFSVNVGGVPLVGHSNVPATLKFNWDAATPLTAEQVTALHQDEATKAQAEAARLEKEKAEKEKAEADKLAKEKADEAARLEKEKAEKEKAEKEKAEREKAEADKLAKEKAEREKAEADKLAKEKAEKEKAEADKLAKEKAEKEKAEADKLAKEKAEKEKAEADRLAKEVEKIEAKNKETVKEAEAAKETVTKLEADKAQLEKLVKEKEEAINNATTEAEKEKLTTEKVAVEKELTAKVTELKTETDKAVKLENKVEEIKKLEEVKKDAVGKIQAENKETVKEAEVAKETVTKLETDKAQLEKLVKEKEAAINNATTEAEKEKLTTEKAAVEKELTAKVTELKTETEKAVKLENKVNEIKQLEAIVKTASLKDTLAAKVEGFTKEITVSFDNTAVKAANFVVKNSDEDNVAVVKEKVEELAKKADKNLSVVKTIDLHFADSKGNIINKQGETRAVTVAVVANEGEKLEVYYVREIDGKNTVLEKVPSAYNPETKELTFFTNHFSRYTIVKEKEGETDQNTSVPVAPAPSTDSTKPVVADENEALTQPELPTLDIEKQSSKGEALVQDELPALNINELSKEQNVKEEAEATAQNIFGQVDNKENKNVEVEKTVAQNTSQTVAKGLKQLAKTGLNATATAALGVLALLSALVLRRRNNK